MTTTTINKENQFNKAVKLIGAALLFVIVAIFAFGLNFYNLYNVTSTTQPPSPELLAYNYFPYLIIGTIAITISLILAWVAVSYSKNNSIIANFVILLVAWLLSIMLSLATAYLFNEIIIDSTM